MFNLFKKIITNNCKISCLLCKASCSFFAKLCTACISSVPANQHACFSCAEPLTVESTDLLCGLCQTKNRAFKRSIVPLIYQHPVAEMLQQLKYSQQLAYAVPLAHVLVKAICHRYQQDDFPEVIVPMPLHDKRLCERGYNQAGVIARHLSKKLSVPVKHRLVQRIKDTKPLLNLSAKARHRYMQGAFQAKQSKFKHIALVDDIITSTASAETVAKACQKKGIERIDLWAIARTPKI